jgi:hypothetical protein
MEVRKEIWRTELRMRTYAWTSPFRCSPDFGISQLLTAEDGNLMKTTLIQDIPGYTEQAQKYNTWSKPRMFDVR